MLCRFLLKFFDNALQDWQKVNSFKSLAANLAVVMCQNDGVAIRNVSRKAAGIRI